MRLMNLVLNSRLASVLLAVLLIVNPALAAERTAIKADPCGPMMALQNAGHSVYLLPFLEHKDGSPLLPAEVRKAPDAEFYLSSEAKPDKAATAEFLAKESEAFGPSPKDSCAQKGPSCEDLLNTARGNLATLNTRLGEAQKAAKDAQYAYKAVSNTLEGERERNRGNIPWWWLLFAIPVVGLVYWLMRRRANAAAAEAEAQRQQLEQQLVVVHAENADLRQRNARLDQDLAAARQQTDALNRRVRELQFEINQLQNPNPPAEPRG